MAIHYQTSAEKEAEKKDSHLTQVSPKTLVLGSMEWTPSLFNRPGQRPLENAPDDKPSSKNVPT